jgi:topoisomerase-4 subunit A
MADTETRLVLASDFGYGFVTRFANLVGNKKAGKQILNLDDKAHVLAPGYVNDPARDRIVVATNAGHLLMFSVAELPELENGGKGNKLIEIPKAKLGGGERVAGITVVTEGSGEITLYAGARKLTLRWADLVEYGGNRAGRGGLLPRGLQRVERLETTA